MQRAIKELEIGGHSVYPGSKVNIKWYGVWYEGTVVKIGPQRKLCRVLDVVTNHTMLLESSQLKFMETQALQRQFFPGTRVVYNNGTDWTEGVVDSCSAIGAAFVRWRQNALSEENETWFEVEDLAPVIHNEAYLATNEDLLAAGKSGLLQNDMIEPRPRTIENLLYESDPESGDSEENDSPMPHKVYGYGSMAKHQQSRQLQQHIPQSPTYESIATRDGVDAPGHPLPELPPQLPFNHHHAGMMHPMYTPFGLKWRDRHPSSQSFPNPKPNLHPKGLRRNLEQASVPCVWSYSRQANGIPPHRSSKFFQRLQRNFPKLNHQRLVHSSQTRSVSTIKQSPSMASETHSEPTPYAEHFFLPAHLARRPLPTREVGKGRVSRIRNSQSVENHRPSKSNKQKASPQPYEVVKPAKSDKKQPLKPLPVLPAPVSQGIKKSESGRVNYSEVEFSLLHGDTRGAPEIVSASPSNLKIPTESSVLLTCLADSKTPITYEWFKDGKRIPDDAPNMVNRGPGMLQILQASINTTGEYSCVVTNEIGSKTRSYQLEVTKGMSSVPEDRTVQSFTPDHKNPQTGFTSKVTYAELNIEAPEIDQTSEKSETSEPPHKHKTKNESPQKLETKRPEAKRPESQSEARMPATTRPESPRKPETKRPQPATKSEAKRPESPQKHESKRPQPAKKSEAKCPESETKQPESEMPEKSQAITPQPTQKPEPSKVVQPRVTHWYTSPLHVYGGDEPEQPISQDEKQEGSAIANPSEQEQTQISTVGETTTQAVVGEEQDSVAPIPRIVVTGERKTSQQNRRRVSSVLKNDMEQYLEGYGQDYGALSSATDLELEGLHPYRPAEIKKSLVMKGESSGSKKKERKNDKSQQKFRKKLHFPKIPKPTQSHFGKRGKKGISVSAVVNTGDEGVHTTALKKDLPEPGQLIAKQLQSHRDMDTAKDDTQVQEAEKEEDGDSVAVNTSLGSSGSETSLYSEKGSGGVSLPLEMESITDQVRRLQLSVEVYSPESLGEGGKGSHDKKKGFKSRFTPKTKAVTGVV